MLAVLVGETPGTSRARSRKLRPLRGRLLHLGLRHRAGNLAASCLEHAGFVGNGQLRLRGANGERNGQLIRRTHGQGQQSGDLREPFRLNPDFVGSDSEVCKAEASFLVGWCFWSDWCPSGEP